MPRCSGEVGVVLDGVSVTGLAAIRSGTCGGWFAAVRGAGGFAAGFSGSLAIAMCGFSATGFGCVDSGLATVLPASGDLEPGADTTLGSDFSLWGSADFIAGTAAGFGGSTAGEGAAFFSGSFDAIVFSSGLCNSGAGEDASGLAACAAGHELDDPSDGLESFPSVGSVIFLSAPGSLEWAFAGISGGCGHPCGGSPFVQWKTRKRSAPVAFGCSTMVIISPD
jgi:hypothetical protein